VFAGGSETYCLFLVGTRGITALHTTPPRFFLFVSFPFPFHIDTTSTHMQIKKLKVRPQKSTLSTSSCSRRILLTRSFHADPPVVLCGPQLASMLGCWAATKDVRSVGACRDHAQTLFDCMRTAVRTPFFVSQQGTNVLHTPGSQ